MFAGEVFNFVGFAVCDFSTAGCFALPLAVVHLASQANGETLGAVASPLTNFAIQICSLGRSGTARSVARRRMRTYG